MHRFEWLHQSGENWNYTNCLVLLLYTRTPRIYVACFDTYATNNFWHCVFVCELLCCLVMWCDLCWFFLVHFVSFDLLAQLYSCGFSCRSYILKCVCSSICNRHNPERVYSFKAMKSKCTAENLCVSLCVCFSVQSLYHPTVIANSKTASNKCHTASSILRNIRNCFVSKSRFIYNLCSHLSSLPIDGSYYVVRRISALSLFAHIHTLWCSIFFYAHFYAMSKMCSKIYSHFRVKMLSIISSTLCVSRLALAKRNERNTKKKHTACHCRYKEDISYNFAGFFVSRSFLCSASCEPQYKAYFVYICLNV